MKNVTKILTAVVLCAAVFASANRIGNLGGNAAFWPGDEANISAFPAQVNNHGYVQLSNVANTGDASAAMVFNHNGTAWGMSFSDSYDDWVNIKWGKNGMGISFSLTNGTSFTPATVAWAAAQDDSMNCGDGSMACGDAVAEVGTAQVGDPGEAFEAATPADCDCAAIDATNGNTACADAWTAQANGGSAADCPGGDYTAADAGQAYVAPSADYAPASVDGPAVEVTTDGWEFGYGNTFDFGELGFHTNDIGDMDIHFRKACGFWVFTDMVAHLSMPDEGGMVLDADWFTHWDASGADVMFAMGMSYDEDNAGLTQTAAIGVEANMTDWASFRAGITWDYQLAGDDEVVGNTDYTWNTGLGFNWGGFTADMSISDNVLADPVGWMTGNQMNGSLATGAMQLTYSF